MVFVDQLEGIRQSDQPLRILAVAATWFGSNSLSYVNAFRRAGHSVVVVPEGDYEAAGWRNPILKAVSRTMRPLIVEEYNRAVSREAEQLSPELLFVFKGWMLKAETLRRLRNRGVVAINVWPDVSVFKHGPYVPEAMKLYDSILTTKTFGVGDLKDKLGAQDVSFLPPGYCKDVHRPMSLNESDRARYAGDFGFIGLWSPKKQALLESVVAQIPAANFKIWGDFWTTGSPGLSKALQRRAVFGSEYAKALGGLKINIALLSEVRAGASQGDLITTRTFEIPAAGGFMLHERNAEVAQYFTEGKECAMFADAGELADKIKYYLEHDEERRAIAAAGHLRCMTSGYSFDDRAAQVVAKARNLIALRQGEAA